MPTKLDKKTQGYIWAVILIAFLIAAGVAFAEDGPMDTQSQILERN